MSSTPLPSRIDRVKALREAMLIQAGLVTSFEKLIHEGHKGVNHLKDQVADLEARAARVRATIEARQAEIAEAPARLASAKAELARMAERLKALEVEPKIDKLESLVEKAIRLALEQGQTTIKIGDQEIDLAALAGAAGGSK